MPGGGGKPFDEPGDENLIAHSSEQVVEYLADFDEAGRRAIAAAAKRRVLAFPTPDRRALEIEGYVAGGQGRHQSAAVEPAPKMEAA